MKAFKLKTKREQELKEWIMWKQGVYVYEALIDVAPILHAFCKKGTKPLPYPEKPYGLEDIEKEKIDKKQEEKNERLKAMVQFNNWARAVSKQFENKAGGNLDGEHNR